MVLVRLSVHRQAGSDIIYTNTHTVTPIDRHTCTVHSHACPYTHTAISRKDCSYKRASFLSWLYKKSPYPHMHVHTHITSCEGFIKLGHEHENKPTRAEGMLMACGEREEEGQRDRYTALKQGNSLLVFFHRADDGQKSAPSRLSAQSSRSSVNRDFISSTIRFRRFVVHLLQWAEPSMGLVNRGRHNKCVFVGC